MLSLMVRNSDQSILWVSDGLANHLGAASDALAGSSVFDSLEGSPSAQWHSVFSGIELTVERFDGLRIHCVGAPTSVDDFELRSVRYVDAGRTVMISLALALPESTPTARPTAVDPKADAARLVASRALLRADTVEGAVGVCIVLVRELGGRMIPARLDDGWALPIDCSFGHGEPLLPIADSPLAQLRLERLLPEVLDDARLVISRIRQSADLQEQARTDPLTGLMNRRATDRVLAGIRTDDALVTIDLDHFKSVNDTWGHAAGDDVLIAYSRALRSSGRSSDHFARIGGEELLAVLPGTDEVELGAFLDRLHETWLATRPYEVTYSAGCAWAGGRSGNETLSVADAALFRAKRTGRDRTIIEPRRVAVVPNSTCLDARRKKDA